MLLCGCCSNSSGHVCCLTLSARGDCAMRPTILLWMAPADTSRQGFSLQMLEQAGYTDQTSHNDLERPRGAADKAENIEDLVINMCG
jgi:hypothetical protein